MAFTPLRDQIDPEPPRDMPCNVAAEQALLGALLCDNREFSRIAKIVRAEDFAWGVHQRIFAAIGKLTDAGMPANPVTLRHLFDNDPALRKAYPGGVYLVRLARSAITLLNGADYAVIIADLALRRKLIRELYELRPAQTSLDILTDLRPQLQTLAKAVRDLRAPQ